MNDHEKTKAQLIEELAELRQRVAALETTEQSRPENERWASLLLDSAPLGIFECNTEGKITFANPAQELITGYSADEMVGTYVWDRIEPGPQKESLFAYVKQLVAEQPPPTPYVNRSIRKDGEFLDVRVDWNYRRNEQGQIIALVFIISDITRQTRMEEELRRSRATLQATIECLPFDFFAIGPDGRYILQNAASRTHWGDACGRRPEDISESEHDLALWRDNNRRALAGERIEEEVTLTRHGEQRSFINILAPIRVENESYGILGVNLDTTDRKRAEAALQQARDELETRVEARTAELARAKREWERTFDTVPDLIAVLDRNSRITRVNRAMAERLALTAEQCIGQTCFEAVHGLGQPPQFCPHTLTLADGKGHAAEIHEDRLGGDFLVTTTPIVDEHNQLLGSVHVARDITERKRAEEALQQSEEKYRGLVDICPDSILVSDLAGRTRFVSKQTWKLLDLPEEEELVGKDTFGYVIEADRPRLAANLAELLRVGRRGYTEYTVLRPNGTTVPIELSSAVIRDAQGRPLATMAILRDISERKRAQEALQQSEEKYRGLIEICPDAVVVTDLTAKATFVSRQTWKLLAISEEKELVGQSVFNYIVEPERPMLAANIASLLETGHQRHVEYTALRPEGTTVPVELSSAVIRDTQGQPIALMAMIRDISDRKQAEETLRQSEEKYRGLIEICPDAVVVTDLTGMATFVSPQAWRLLAIPEQEELVGRSVFGYVIESDRPRMVEGILDLLAEGKHKHSEYTGVRPDGATIPTEISTAVIRDAQGQPIALMAMIRDISDRKQAEQALRQHYEELRAIYDGMAEGLVILDVATDECIRANRSVCAMLGYSEEELKTLPVEKLHQPEMLPERARRHQAMIEGQLSHAEDVPLVRKDGSILYVDIVSDRITYNGRPCLIHLLRDTTERRQAQEALKKEHRTLKHLLQSSDHERQLIAYEIHDGLTQQLAGAIMQLDTYAYQKDHKPKDAAKAYDAAITMLRQAHFEARRLISGVRPPILDESGIVAAIAHLVNEHRLQNGPKVELRSDLSFDRLAPIMENAIYRIVQEGLANACKHSKSPKVRVELVQLENVLQIKVRDWGIGFDPNTVKDDRFGLEGIRERARLLGGRTSVESSPQQGTCITVELPLALREQ